MPHYKLTYFAVKGVAQGIRFLLSYMEADWEDNRIELFTRLLITY